MKEKGRLLADCRQHSALWFYRFLLICLQSLPFSPPSSAALSIAFIYQDLLHILQSFIALNFLPSDWADNDRVGDRCKPACRGVGGNPGVWYHPETLVWARFDWHEEPGKQLLPQFCHASALHHSRFPEQVSASSFFKFYFTVSIVCFLSCYCFSRLKFAFKMNKAVEKKLNSWCPGIKCFTPIYSCPADTCHILTRLLMRHQVTQPRTSKLKCECPH